MPKGSHELSFGNNSISSLTRYTLKALYNSANIDIKTMPYKTCSSQLVSKLYQE